MLYLIKLSLFDGIEVYQMLQEIAANDNGFHNKVCGMSYVQFREWLEREYAFDNGCLEDWMVPQTSYWLYEDEKAIGYGRIRHCLNEKLEETSGHIGYAIRCSERGKGYGTQILSLLLEECRKLNIKSVQIGANSGNIASNKVILKHGGVWIRCSNHKNFYRIDLD